MAAVSANVNPVWLAMSRLRRRRFGDCVALCDSVLSNPTAAASSSSAPGADLAALSLKTRALTAAARGAVDDADLDVDGVAELLFDDSGKAGDDRGWGAVSDRAWCYCSSLRRWGSFVGRCKRAALFS